MATDMQKLVGTSEEDDEEEMEMDVKEEDDDDEENGKKHVHRQMVVGVDVVIAPSSSNNNQFHHHQQIQEQVGTPGGGAVQRCRPLEEKERTKLRERHRRSITARILAGLRRHGNYNLRVRADINDVIAALAREAGWVALPDETTFPSRSQGSRPAIGTSAMIIPSSQMVSQQTAPTFKAVSPGYRSSVEYNSGCMKGVFMPTMEGVFVQTFAEPIPNHVNQLPNHLNQEDQNPNQLPNHEVKPNRTPDPNSRSMDINRSSVFKQMNLMITCKVNITPKKVYS